MAHFWIFHIAQLFKFKWSFRNYHSKKGYKKDFKTKKQQLNTWNLEVNNDKMTSFIDHPWKIHFFCLTSKSQNRFVSVIYIFLKKKKKKMKEVNRKVDTLKPERKKLESILPTFQTLCNTRIATFWFSCKIVDFEMARIVCLQNKVCWHSLVNTAFQNCS